MSELLITLVVDHTIDIGFLDMLAMWFSSLLLLVLQHNVQLKSIVHFSLSIHYSTDVWMFCGDIQVT